MANEELIARLDEFFARKGFDPDKDGDAGRWVGQQENDMIVLLRDCRTALSAVGERKYGPIWAGTRRMGLCACCRLDHDEIAAAVGEPLRRGTSIGGRAITLRMQLSPRFGSS